MNSYRAFKVKKIGVGVCDVITAKSLIIIMLCDFSQNVMIKRHALELTTSFIIPLVKLITNSNNIIIVHYNM